MFKRSLISVLLLTSLFSQAQNDFDKIVQSERKSFRHLHKDYRAAAENNTNVIYQRLALRANPWEDSISGSVITYFIPATNIQYIEFDLTDDLTVDSVLYHGDTLSFLHTNEVLHIPFPTALTPQQTDSIEVVYHGVPGISGFGSFIQSMHDSVPVIWTLSEPYGAKDWWPCKQNLQDKIDSIDLLVTTPDSFRVAGNGLLVAEIHHGNEVTFHWKHRYPIASYLVCFAVTNYVAYYDYVPFNGDTLPVLNYVYPEHLAEAQQSTARIVPMIQLYDSLFGAYPFSKEKYGQAEFGWGGGMEHQTMTFITGFGFELMAHELGHHWFGDKVTCASWHDIWLNEGFATYLSGLCYEHLAHEWWESFKISRIISAVQEPNGSVWCDDTTSVSRVFSNSLTYSKGAMVLHMLRFELGDSIFFAALRNYLYDVNLAYSFATTTDLRLHLEAASGKDLKEFFDDWVYGKGFPSYQISWQQDFSNQVQVTIEQTQSDPSVSYFEMPVPIRLKNAFRDTTLILNNSSSGQKYVFTLPFIADSLLFDPDYWLISKGNNVTRKSAYEFLFSIYPNPVSNQLQIEFQSQVAENVEMEIYNDAGQLISKQTFAVTQGSNHTHTETGGFSSGVYHLTVKAGGKTYHASFVKAKN